MDKISVVIQGPLYSFTNNIAGIYEKLNSVDEIIISCWENDDIRILEKNNKIKILQNAIPNNPGIGNRNCQIVSSLNGAKLANGDIVIKTRSDMMISNDSMNTIIDFYKKNKTPEFRYIAGNGPVSKIFSMRNYLTYPFHPDDHLFIGHKSDIIDLFDIPLDDNYNKNIDYSTYIRTEAYIGSYYYSKFDNNILKYINNPSKYLTDCSKCIDKAFATYYLYFNKIIKSLPKLSGSWPKYGYSDLPYDIWYSMGARWDEHDYG
jgi:hypothetical protein